MCFAARPITIQKLSKILKKYTQEQGLSIEVPQPGDQFCARATRRSRFWALCGITVKRTTCPSSFGSTAGQTSFLSPATWNPTPKETSSTAAPIFRHAFESRTSQQRHILLLRLFARGHAALCRDQRRKKQQLRASRQRNVQPPARRRRRSVPNRRVRPCDQPSATDRISLSRRKNKRYQQKSVRKVPARFFWFRQSQYPSSISSQYSSASS